MTPEEEAEARKAPHIEVDVVLEALQTPEQFSVKIQDNFIQDFSARFQVGLNKCYLSTTRRSKITESHH